MCWPVLHVAEISVCRSPRSKANSAGSLATGWSGNHGNTVDVRGA